MAFSLYTWIEKIKTTGAPQRSHDARSLQVVGAPVRGGGASSPLHPYLPLCESCEAATAFLIKVIDRIPFYVCGNCYGDDLG
jgi:hypothetical protein